MIAVDKNLPLRIERFMDKAESTINYHSGDISRIVCIHKVKKQSIAANCETIFRVILRSSTPFISKKSPVIWLLTCVNNIPLVLDSNLGFEILFPTYKKVWMNFVHTCPLPLDCRNSFLVALESLLNFPLGQTVTRMRCNRGKALMELSIGCDPFFRDEINQPQQTMAFDSISFSQRTQCLVACQENGFQLRRKRKRKAVNQRYS